MSSLQWPCAPKSAGSKWWGGHCCQVVQSVEGEEGGWWEEEGCGAMTRVVLNWEGGVLEINAHTAHVV